jgi:hypothetical protein
MESKRMQGLSTGFTFKVDELVKGNCPACCEAVPTDSREEVA